jgi:Zn-dependent protease with chaperone function
MIQFMCPKCGKRLRAAADSIGKKAKCGGCAAVLRIPDTAAHQADTRRLPQSPAPAETAGPAGQLADAKLASPTRSARPAVASTSQALPPRGAASAESPRSLPLEPSATSIPAHEFTSLLDSAIAEGRAQGMAKVRQQLRMRVTSEDIRRAIPEPLPKHAVSFAYRLRLLLVAATVTTLPCLYVGLIVLAAAGVFYYVTQVIPSLTLSPMSGRAWLIYLLLIATPAVAGVILVVFMLKPLFFRIVSDTRRRSLTRQGEPRLFELVDAISESVGAPKPARIDVDYQVNASASPAGGLLSVASGNLVLTIGVPLVAGLSARQLSGVLAHEFGHFAQKVGMGSTVMITRVNGWFLRVIYQRDSLDEALDDWINDSEWYIALVLSIAKLAVMTSRGILWCLMVVGHAVSASLLRQMEYDADRYEYDLVGSETFEQTSRELPAIVAANQAALSQLYELFTKGVLADDMILLQDRIHRDIPDSVRQKIEQSTEQAQQGWFDSHPTDSKRIARARSAARPGSFHLDRPARDLLEHYDALCQNVTSDFFRDQFGERVLPDQFTSSNSLLRSLQTSASDSAGTDGNMEDLKGGKI